MIGTGSEGMHQDHGIFKNASSKSPLLSAERRLVWHCHWEEVELAVIAPLKEGKYHAGIDTYISCRLTAGFELTAWTSVPWDMGQMSSGTPLDLAMKGSRDT